VNDRLPYADVSIATALVGLGVAVAAYPWLGELSFAALLVGLIAIAVLGIAGARRPRNVVSGHIPWT